MSDLDTYRAMLKKAEIRFITESDNRGNTYLRVARGPSDVVAGFDLHDNFFNIGAGNKWPIHKED